MKETVYIDSEFITLGQLLKHVNIISSGGMAKWYLAEHTVLLDNEVENRRGKKIFLVQSSKFLMKELILFKMLVNPKRLKINVFRRN